MPLLPFAGAAIATGLIIVYCLFRADFEGIRVDKNVILPAVGLILGGVILALGQFAVMIVNLLITVS